MNGTTPWLSAEIPVSENPISSVSAFFNFRTNDFSAMSLRLVERVSVALNRGGLDGFSLVDEVYMSSGNCSVYNASAESPVFNLSTLNVAKFPEGVLSDQQLKGIFDFSTICVSATNSSLFINGSSIDGLYLTGDRDSENRRITSPRFWIQGFVSYTPLAVILSGLSSKMSPVLRLSDINPTNPPLAISLSFNSTISQSVPVCGQQIFSKSGCSLFTVGVSGSAKLTDYEARYRSEFWPIWFASRASDIEGEFNVSLPPKGPSFPYFKSLTSNTSSSTAWTLFSAPQDSWAPQVPQCVVGTTCDSLTIAPSGRFSHTAVLYRSWTVSEMLQHQTFCRLTPSSSNSACGSECSTNTSCLFGRSTDMSLYYSSVSNAAGWASAEFVNDDGFQFPVLDPHYSQCPSSCCGGRRLCTRLYDELGRRVPYDGLFMLVFGGKTRQVLDINGKDFFLNCEALLEGNSDKDQSLHSCLEFQSNELWRYDVDADFWELIKPATGIDASGESMGFPPGRFAHGSAVVTIPAENDPNGFMRKFMYIYGGLGNDCLSGICADVWKFEIPYAPQAAWPYSGGRWQSGAAWTSLQSNPYGGRYGHKMVATDSGDYLFVFGGRKAGEFLSDLLLYRIASDTWELQSTLGYKYFTRTVVDYLGDELEFQISDLSQLRPHNSEDSYGPQTERTSNSSQQPVSRADSVLLTFDQTETGGSVTTQLISIGGFHTYNSPYPGASMPYPTYPYYLSDTWNFDHSLMLWTQTFFQKNSEQPSARRGATAVKLLSSTGNLRVLLFGGHQQDKLFNDLWYYHTTETDPSSRKWTNLNTFIEGPSPAGVAYHSMVSDAQTGLVITFGGLSWYRPNYTITDAFVNRDNMCFKNATELTSRFTVTLEAVNFIASECQGEMRGFCCDSLSAVRSAARVSEISSICTLSCQAKKFKPVFAPEFTLGTWIYNQSACSNDCSGNGQCEFSTCVCKPGFSGEDCNTTLCPGSVCYADSYTHQQFCTYCNQRGTCTDDAVCLCDSGWQGEDCGAAECPNDCSGNGICIEDFPSNQCVCQGAYSGSDCSQLLCLNQCSNTGDCINGTCSCSPGYYGTDCSVYVPGAGAERVVLTSAAISFLIFLIVN